MHKRNVIKFEKAKRKKADANFDEFLRKYLSELESKPTTYTVGLGKQTYDEGLIALRRALGGKKP